MFKHYSKIITICSLLLLLFSAFTCLAQNSLVTPGQYSPNCIEKGDCQLSDFTRIFVIAASLILSVTGSLALLFFIYGGIMFLISGGSSERVNQAKQILIGAVIGIVVVFTSYMIIQFVFTAMGVPGAANGSWAKLGWFGGNQ